MNITHSAAICYKRDATGIKFLLIRSRHGNYWVIPKGKQEEGEISWQTAKREAYEEAGVLGVISEEPLAAFRFLKSPSHSENHIVAFLMEIEKEEAPLEDITIRRPKWHSAEEAISALAENRKEPYIGELQKLIKLALVELEV